MFVLTPSAECIVCVCIYVNACTALFLRLFWHFCLKTVRFRCFILFEKNSNALATFGLFRFFHSRLSVSPKNHKWMHYVCTFSVYFKSATDFHATHITLIWMSSFITLKWKHWANVLNTKFQTFDRKFQHFFPLYSHANWCFRPKKLIFMEFMW